MEGNENKIDYTGFELEQPTSLKSKEEAVKQSAPNIIQDNTPNLGDNPKVVKSALGGELPLSVGKIVKYTLFSFLAVAVFYSAFVYAEHLQDIEQFDGFKTKLIVFSDNKDGNHNPMELKNTIDSFNYTVESQTALPDLAKCEADANTNSWTYDRIVFHFLNAGTCYELNLTKKGFSFKQSIGEKVLTLFLFSLVLLWLMKRTDPFLFWDSTLLKNAIKGKTPEGMMKQLESHKNYIEKFHLEEDSESVRRQREMYFISYALITEFNQYPFVRKTYKKTLQILSESYSELTTSFSIDFKLLQTLNYKKRYKVGRYLLNVFLQVTSSYLTNPIQLFLFIFLMGGIHGEVYMLITKKYDQGLSFIAYLDEMIGVMSNLGGNMEYLTDLEKIFHMWITMLGVVLFGLFLGIINKGLED